VGMVLPDQTLLLPIGDVALEPIERREAFPHDLHDADRQRIACCRRQRPVEADVVFLPCIALDIEHTHRIKPRLPALAPLLAHQPSSVRLISKNSPTFSSSIPISSPTSFSRILEPRHDEPAGP